MILSEEEDFYRLFQNLTVFHSVFRTLWNIGVPRFDDTLSTAGVRFNEENVCIDFLFNKNFWHSLNDYEKCFVICHECLHVILDHGRRSKGLDPTLVNVAEDISVNHLLVESFGFERELIRNQQSLCWVDTVFGDKNVPSNKNFEYYYEKLVKEGTSSEVSTVDEHCDVNGESTLPDDSTLLPSIVKSAIEGSMSKEDLDSLEDCIENDAPGGLGHPGDPLIPGRNSHVFSSKEKTDRVWDKIISKVHYISTGCSKSKTVLTGQFIFDDRRLAFLNKNFLIPNEYDVEKVYDTPEVYLYLDCSGSCYMSKDTFFDLACKIDSNKYKVKLFSRTTEVHEMTKIGKNKYKSNSVDGSDDYRCIEKHIQSELSSGNIRKHPIVIHLTDGHDCSDVMVKPSKPELWIWILTYDYQNWIPKECKHRYLISNGKITQLLPTRG